MATLDEKMDALTATVTETQEMICHVVKHMATKEEFDQLDGKVSQLDGKVSQLDGKVNRITTAVVNLQGDMSDVKERMVTREQFDESLTKEDAMMVILKRFDEEHVATTAWIQRVESDVLMLKRHLHLA